MFTSVIDPWSSMYGRNKNFRKVENESNWKMWKISLSSLFNSDQNLQLGIHMFQFLGILFFIASRFMKNINNDVTSVRSTIVKICHIWLLERATSVINIMK